MTPHFQPIGRIVDALLLGPLPGESSVGILRPSLGRVETGAIAALQIPEESLAGNATFVRIAVIAGERMTLQAALHPRATLTVAQPTSAILSQRWPFAQGGLTSLQR